MLYEVITRLVKQRDEAASQYKEAGREDLYEQEKLEAEILKSYLPEQLSDAELEAAVKELVASVGARNNFV